MKKILTLTKEQARLLYNLLSGHEVPSRSDNRKRFGFLEVIEDFVFAFDDEVRGFDTKGKTQKQVNDALSDMGEQAKNFTFNDREIFAKVKDMFEKLYEIGNISRSNAGQVTRSPLVGRDAMIYVELEDAFMDVKEVKDKKK